VQAVGTAIASTYGFFPSSPVIANYWIDLLLMRQYHMLAHKEAVSGGCE
jgi:hypothetical protein